MSLVGGCGVNVSALKKVIRFDNSEAIFMVQYKGRWAWYARTPFSSIRKLYGIFRRLN